MTAVGGSAASSPGGAADPAALAGAVQRLEGAFAELMTVFRRYYADAAETASPGLPPSSFKLLASINRAGSITLSQLAEHVGSDKGLASRQVSELEQLGFVERTTDPDDRRIRLITVTDLGRSRLAAAREPYHREMTRILSDWPIESIDSLASLLQALAAGERPRDLD